MSKTENSKTITLSNGVLRGEKTINEITVLKPTVLALKGLSLINVLNMDVDAMATLLPKITSPALHKNDVYALEIEDFIEISGAVAGFLVKPEVELEA